MKKIIWPTLMILLIASCVINKKPYYVFKWVPKQDADSIARQDTGDEITLNTYDEQSILIQAENENANSALAPSPRQKNAKILPKKSEDKRSKVGAKDKEALHSDRLEIASDNSVKARSGDKLLLTAGAIVGLSLLTLLNGFGKLTNKLTRWAKANPRKTQGAIAAMQLSLLSSCLLNGHNLNKMGYEISDNMMYGLGGATLLGLLMTKLFPKRDTFALPSRVRTQRLLFAGITLSSLMMATGFGNHIERNYPNSTVVMAVNSADSFVFENAPKRVGQTPDSNNLITREAAAEMTAAGAFFLGFLLTILACAGICLAGFGIAALSSGDAGNGILMTLGGVLLLFLAIKGFIGIHNARARSKF